MGQRSEQIMRAFSMTWVVAVVVGAMGCEREPSAAPAEASAASAASAAEQPREIDPCALLTPSEAGEFLGATATPKHSTAIPQVSSCIWEAIQPLRGLLVMVSTPAQLRADKELTKLGADTIETRFQQLTQQAPPDKSSPVAAVGDAALWRQDLRQLWVVKKNRALITISFHNGDMTYAFERSKAVAGKVLARL